MLATNHFITPENQSLILRSVYTSGTRHIIPVTACPEPDV